MHRLLKLYPDPARSNYSRKLALTPMAAGRLLVHGHENISGPVRIFNYLFHYECGMGFLTWNNVGEGLLHVVDI